jgi:hypothetical protein
MVWVFLPSIFPLFVTIKKLSNTESFFIFSAIGANLVIVLSEIYSLEFQYANDCGGVKL